MDKPKLLVVEDDENLAFALEDNLSDEGYAVFVASTLEEAKTQFPAFGAAGAANSEPALVLLDVMLPDGDGYAFCEQLRAKGYGGGILMLTARSLEEDIVRGFAAGADDYVTKPYRIAVLLARVNALLARRRGAAPAPAEALGGDAVALGAFSVDRRSRALTGPDGEVSLTRTAFDLLLFFIDNKDRALTRDEILDSVWGDGVFVDHRTVDNFVSTLKKKLKWSEASPFRIHTIRGVGYRFEHPIAGGQS